MTDEERKAKEKRLEQLDMAIWSCGLHVSKINQIFIGTPLWQKLYYERRKIREELKNDRS